MFNSSRGARIEAPYWSRYFSTTDDDTGGNLVFSHASLGDIRLRGIYTGMSDTMSTGVTFGLKLPTGDRKYAGFDRDTQIGTGSLDLLLGLYHLGTLTDDNLWS